ncbi:BTAD domain-containing putative transcriptional regulator [Actinoplanes sp. Pm04-4]|uniref:BTAD domain-containing putative transcriptional regulator n=1 Tax=Paractinoplanes pyxinae TaxID=2997416 RepID=A0ABT4B3M3_9ACTN|nr:BTAD domain-containing putative transcriptional regulator [Actinoplanes pyxinae]MCY1141080.1 BTAD domain-containing putative transcriptional regulator [Actinoplanes pyxinae]
MAWRDAGEPIPLKGPVHRAVLARLIVARGRVVPVGHLVDNLWTAPPEGAISAVRTFVAALRRALEPDRPPRTPPSLLVTEGPGYALHAAPDSVDAWRFEQALKRPEALAEALGWWRGPAYADFPEAPWAQAERARLAELRLHAVELLAESRPPAEAVPDLEAHVTEHPWREEGWRLLALALYRTGRQGDALAVLRRAREQLVDRLGLDPGPALRELETSILRQDVSSPSVWADAAADYERSVGARARLGSTVGLLRTMAVTGGGGGLEAAGRHRLATIAAAEELGDTALTARVIGAYDVPAIWTRSDDPARAAQIVAAARRALPSARGASRVRLLATIAVESRGPAGPQRRGAPWPSTSPPAGATRPTSPDSAAERFSTAATETHRSLSSGDAVAAATTAVASARELDDPRLLAFALNGLFMQTFHRCGLAPERDAIGAELIALSMKHDLPTYEVLGRLIRVQSRSALADFAAADEHAAAADHLATDHELPLVAVFTEWYRAMRQATPDAYRAAARRLSGAGMPGLEQGLLALALLCLGQPDHTLDYGPYEPWARPHVLLAHGRTEEAGDALRRVPEPPPDLVSEALWCLTARAAVALGERDIMERARVALLPAAGQIAAGSGVLTAGPIDDVLALIAGA